MIILLLQNYHTDNNIHKYHAGDEFHLSCHRDTICVFNFTHVARLSQRRDKALAAFTYGCSSLKTLKMPY